MRLILIRHGQTSSNTNHLLDTGFPGAPLTELGESQAQSLVARLAAEPIDVVVSSDLVRAQQTAAPLAAARGLTPLIDPGLREIFAGDLEMSPDWLEYFQIVEGWSTDPARRIPGGEDGYAFMARFDRALLALATAGHRCAAVVSHGGALRRWLSSRIELPAELGNDWHLANTATTVLEYEAGNWRLRRWADGVDHVTWPDPTRTDAATATTAYPRAVVTAAAPAAIGPYSQAVDLGDVVYTAGVIPLDPATGALVGTSAGEQTVQVLANLRAVLAAAQLELSDVVKTTLFVADLADFAAINAAYAEVFQGPPLPARTTVQVTALPKGALIELEAVARRPVSG